MAFFNLKQILLQAATGITNFDKLLQIATAKFEYKALTYLYSVIQVYPIQIQVYHASEVKLA